MLEEPKPSVEPSSLVGLGTTGMPVNPTVTWPAKRSAATVLRQATSAFHPSEVMGAPDECSDANYPPLDDLEYGKIVVRYANGRIIKGFTYNFYPNRLSFHILPAIAGLSGETIEVRIKDLKAVFFVRDFGGNPSYNERKEFAEGERPPGRKVEVTFADGEVLVGSTLCYDTRRQGFFIIPIDTKSNNLKVFVISEAVTKVRFL